MCPPLISTNPPNTISENIFNQILHQDEESVKMAGRLQEGKDVEGLDATVEGGRRRKAGKECKRRRKRHGSRLPWLPPRRHTPLKRINIRSCLLGDISAIRRWRLDGFFKGVIIFSYLLLRCAYDVVEGGETTANIGRWKYGGVDGGLRRKGEEEEEGKRTTIIYKAMRMRRKEDY